MDRPGEEGSAMSNHHTRGRRAVVEEHRRRRRRLQLLGGATLAVALVGVGILAILSFSGGSGDSENQPSTADWSTTPFAGGARLAVDQTVIDSGAIGYNEPVEATYRVRNV